MGVSVWIKVLLWFVTNGAEARRGRERPTSEVFGNRVGGNHAGGDLASYFINKLYTREV